MTRDTPRRKTLSKVPAITLGFWVINVATLKSEAFYCITITFLQSLVIVGLILLIGQRLGGRFDRQDQAWEQVL